MRRFTLLIIIVLCGATVFGQRFKLPEVYNPYGAETMTTNLPTGKLLKSEGEVFYLQTFDFADPNSETGWSMPEGWSQNDVNDLGHVWEWRAGTDSIKGKFTFEKGHIYSESPEDGFWVLPMDEYNLGMELALKMMVMLISKWLP